MPGNPDAIGPPAGGWPPRTVFMAVIDDGVAFAHERLRRPDGTTRVEAFWNMNIPSPLKPTRMVGELLKVQIDQLLATSVRGGAVDEELIYRRCRLVDHRSPLHKTAAWRRSHGAHVIDLAAGAEPVDDVTTRPVIAVQLPTPTVARTIGDWRLDADLGLALDYVLDRARRLGGTGVTPPLVINASFGYIAGRHDGSGVLERRIDKIVRDHSIAQGGRGDVQVVLSAGNAHLSRCHAEVDLSDVRVLDVAFDWVVQPNDRTHSVVQVWLPGLFDPFADRLKLEVKAPDGRPMTVTEALLSSDSLPDAAGRTMASVYHVPYLMPNLDVRSLFYLAISPTDRPQPSDRAVAPAGTWELTFTRGPQRLLEPAQVWVQRDDSLYGYPQRGRQSYFEDEFYRVVDDNGREVLEDDDPAHPTPTSPIKRKSLFNAIATGGRVITAGGYFDRDGVIAPYSAGGPNTPPEAAPRTKPDALLPSEGSKAHPGILAAGSRSGARVPISGTSVAAPQLARDVADWIGAGLAADRDAVAAAADAGDPVPNPPRRPLDRSAGRLAGIPLTVQRYEPGD